jgi:hypothetical protein
MTTEVDQAIAELQELVKCRCDPAYEDRGLHDPNCQCDYASEVKVIVDYIEQLNAKLAEAKDEIAECHKEAMSWVERWGAALKGQRGSDEKLAKAVETLEIARVHVANNAQGWSVSRAPSRDDLTIVDSAIAELKGKKDD